MSSSDYGKQFITKLQRQPWCQFKASELAILENCLTEFASNNPSLNPLLVSLATDAIYLESSKKERYLAKTKQDKIDEKQMLQELTKTRKKIDQTQSKINEVTQLKNVFSIQSNVEQIQNQFSKVEHETRLLRNNLIEHINQINFSLKPPKINENSLASLTNINSNKNSNFTSLSPIESKPDAIRQLCASLMKSNVITTINGNLKEREKFLQELCFSNLCSKQISNLKYQKNVVDLSIDHHSKQEQQFQYNEGKIINAYLRVMCHNLNTCLAYLSEISIFLCKFINFHTRVAPIELQYRQTLQRLVRLLCNRNRDLLSSCPPLPEFEFYKCDDIEELRQLLKLPLDF